MMVSAFMLSATFSYWYAECHYAECRYAACCGTLITKHFLQQTHLTSKMGQLIAHTLCHQACEQTSMQRFTKVKNI
jgi:hypothetical protein